MQTRVFVTNALSFLAQCDHVVYLEDGCIVESGPYDQLRARNGPFAHFLTSKQNQEDTVPADDCKPLRRLVLRVA